VISKGVMRIRHETTEETEVTKRKKKGEIYFW